MSVLTAILASTAFAVECAQPVAPADLEATLTAADEASAALDDATFRDKVNVAAGLLLPCVNAPLSPTLAAHHHRVMALHLLTTGDEVGARSAVEAAKAADPTYVFPDDLLPANHPLRQHYEAWDVDPPARNVPEPREGSLAFDGQNGRRRPKLHPTIAQRFDAQGMAQSTSYLGAREPLPPYRAIPRQRTALMLGSASALVVSGTMYGLAWAQRGDLFASAADPDVSADTLDAKRGRTNGLTIGSGAFFAIAVGAGVGAAAIGER
jgi:hypothetical protein